MSVHVICISQLVKAGGYVRDRDDEATYLLLFRHAHLVLTNLVVHPSRNDPDTKAALVEAQRQVQSNLVRLEKLKPSIDERYQHHLKRVEEQEARQKSNEHRTAQDEDSRGTLPWTEQLQAHENTDVAVKVAQKEFSRRATSRQEPPRSSTTNRDDYSDRMRAIESSIGTNGRQTSYSENLRRSQADVSSSGYRYPSIPASRPAAASVSSPPASLSHHALSPPSLPPKVNDSPVHAPARPEKGIISAPRRSITPQDDRSFGASAFLENGGPLRPLFLPATLRTTFLRIAHKNTMANLETCAFLAGTLMKNAFFISKLIVPAQTSTSDTCEMTNESQLFDYVDSHDLMVLGWIHTHPTQTCFMSSRDLHTHSGYQMMLAESVAIVCAPSKGDTTYGGDWGVYRLTDPPGKKAILNCEKPGIFHPHDVDNIYTDAMKPGHVIELKEMEFEVVDLR